MSINKADIKSLSRAELENKIIQSGQKRFRADQIFGWLYRSRARSFDEMTDLPEALRGSLKDSFHIDHFVVSDSIRSSRDGTTRYLFRLEDGNTIETVFLPESDRATICLSSQVGCKHACSFCASAPFGFVRNLKQSEILDEVIWVERLSPSPAVTNLVFMGIGEPLDNYDNVMGAVRIFNDKDAFNIGARRITISTCGLIPGIERLEKEGLQIELSVSLHSPDDKVRSQLVPINKRYPIPGLIDVCRKYIDRTNRVITFEYILIKGVNASVDDAVKLARLLEGMKCKVNTMLYNKVGPKGYSAPPQDEVKAFISALKSEGMNVTMRKSKGDDIDAACGQLRISRMGS